MVFRIKVEEFYEVEIDVDSAEAARDVLENPAECLSDFRLYADYVGRDTYIEAAKNAVEHHYIQVDVN